MTDGTGSWIDRSTLFGVLWTAIAVSTCFVIFRLAVRWKVFGKLFWDDGFIILSMITFLGIGAVLQIYASGMFLMEDIKNGRVPLTQEGIAIVLRNLRIQLAALIMFFTSLWSVKVAFLIFFKRLGARIRSQKIWWWIVMVFVVSTYISLLPILPYRCITGDLQYVAGYCASIPSLNYYYTVFYYHMSVDILTDILILTIPISLLWNVQMPTRQKLSLMGLFSLTILSMLFAIIRFAVNGQRSGKQQDAPWIAFWATLELWVAIVVACLGSFRQLFTNSKANSSNNSSDPGNSFNMTNRVKRIVPVKWRDASRGFHRRDPSSQPLTDSTISPYDGEERMEVTKSIVVQREVEITRTEIPLKRASTAHVAHHSFLPTERRYKVVHPDDVLTEETPSSKPGFI